MNYNAGILPGQTLNTINIQSLDVDINKLNSLVLRKTNDDWYSFTEKKVISKYPKIILCKTWMDLINACYPDLKNSSDDKTVPENGNYLGVAEIDQYSEGANEKKKSLANYIGIPIEYCDSDKYSYVLVRMDYMAGSYDLKEGKEKEIFDSFEIPKFDFNSKEKIKSALSTLTSTGTHLVETVNVGECIFQIFVYTPQKFEAISTQQWDDDLALNFQFFTSKKYCEYVCPIKILSGTDIFSGKDDLLEDEEYSHSKSIFKVPYNTSLLDCVKNGTNVIPLNIQLSSCIVSSDSELYSLLKEVSIQARIARFGLECVGQTYNQKENTIDYAILYQDFCGQDVFFDILAPFHSISQLYVNLNTILDQKKIYNLKDLKNLIITADVIEIEDDIDLSKIDNLILECRLLITGKKEFVPSIKLSNNLYDKKIIYCNEMIGSCFFYVEGDSKKRQFVFGTFATSFIFEKDTTDNLYKIKCNNFFVDNIPKEKFYIEVKEKDDTSFCNVDEWIKETLETGIQIILSSASVPVSTNFIEEDSSKAIAVEAYKCINWIVKYTKEICHVGVNKGSVPSTLSSLYALALQVRDESVNPNMDPKKFFPNVPLLHYDFYKNAVDSLLGYAEEYSRQIESTKDMIRDINEKIAQKTRDENIKYIAEFLNTQNEAFAKKEQEIADLHEEIINKKNDTLKDLTSQENELYNELNNRIDELNIAANILNKAVSEKIKEEQEHAILDLVMDLGSCLAGAFTFAAAAAAVPETFVKIEKFLKTADAFKKSVEFINEIAKTTSSAINVDSIISYGENREKIESKPIDAPSDIEWNDFLAEATSNINKLRDKGYCSNEANDYNAIVEKLVNVGKALNNIREQIRQCNYDIFVEYSNMNIAKNHSSRLNNLSIHIEKNDWSADNDYYADFGMFYVILQQKMNNILLKLIRIARLQNDAMTYHYLCEPASIKQFDLMAVKQMLFEQEYNAATHLPDTQPVIPEDPIVITLENVPIKELTNEGFSFTVDFNEKKFMSYAKVRIDFIDARIEGVKTSTGNCLVEINSFGNPMHDRGYDRSELSYKTVQKKWHTLYDIKSDKTLIKPDYDFGKIYAQQTPFQTFLLTLPKDKEYNIDLSFEKNVDTTTIKILFYIRAVFSVHQTNKNFQLFFKEDDPYAFLQNLQNKPVIGASNSDVVTFVATDAINNLWEKRWEKEKDDNRFWQFIQFKKETLLGETSLDLNLGTPLFSFNAQNNPSPCVNIRIPIKDAKLIITHDGQTREKNFDSKDKSCFLLTQCALQSIRGYINQNLDADEGCVYIKAEEKTFYTEDFEIDPIMDSDLCIAISDAIKEKGFEPWLLGRITSLSKKILDVPDSILFNAYHSENPKNPDVLGIYSTHNHQETREKTWADDAWVIGEKSNSVTYISLGYWNTPWFKYVKQAFKDSFGYPCQSENNCFELFCGDYVSLPVYYGCGYGDVCLPYEQPRLKQDLNGFYIICDGPLTPPRFGTILGLFIGKINFTKRLDFSINSDTFEVSFQEISKNPDILIEGDPKEYIPDIRKEIVRRLTVLSNELEKVTIPAFAESNLLFPEYKMFVPEKVATPNDIAIVGNMPNDPPPST